MSVFLYPLGRNTPPDFQHVEKYPLSALGDAAPIDVPIVLGINWYTSFDNPIPMDSREEGTSYHLPDVEKGADLGTVRGGHGICTDPMGAVKLATERLRKFYDQKREGACVGAGVCRSATIAHGSVKLFDLFDLYDRARALEGNTGEGTYVRSAFAVMQKEGPREQTGQVVCVRGSGDGPPDPTFGIAAYRWATTVDEVLAALARPNAQAIPFPNNWGDAYPAVTWMPVATLDRLLKEEGEAGIPTER